MKEKIIADLPSKYKPFNEWQWKNYEGRAKVSVSEFISKNKDSEFFIGTDSKNYKKHHYCVFTTVLIAYRRGKGGSIIVHRDKVQFIESLRQRLVEEAMRSLEVGWYLDSQIPASSFIGIHLDVNANLKYKSGKYKEELVGLVMAQGFNLYNRRVLVKPDAWAATGAADRKC